MITFFGVFAFTTVLLLGIIGGFLPLLVYKCVTPSRIDSFTAKANLFAGGVFLSAAFVHLLPDAFEELTELTENAPFNVSGVILFFSFLFIMILDQSTHGSAHGHKDKVEIDIEEEHSHNDLLLTTKGEASNSGILLAVLLSVHSLFAGLSLGLTSDTGAYAILIAIYAHKGTAAFSLGIALDPFTTSRKTYSRIILAFSACTPVGIALGIFLKTLFEEYTTVVTWFSGVGSIIACATFLYVGIIELIMPYYKKKISAAKSGFYIVLGGIVMIIVAILESVYGDE
ncbi:hypothetical protein PCE1_003838 [Barthelona sp. PCE]